MVTKVQKEVEVVEVPVQKQVHVPMVETVQKQVEVPQARVFSHGESSFILGWFILSALGWTAPLHQVQYEDQVVHVPVQKHVHVPMVQTVQKQIEVPQIEYEDQIVEVPVQKHGCPGCRAWGKGWLGWWVGLVVWPRGGCKH
eukprot:Skav212532  [mRNA]  locus=scaffold1851:72242:73694:+ [translate_table: standard]